MQVDFNQPLKCSRRITDLVCHHSASNERTTVQQIDAWHKARGWAGIGYHFVIRLNDDGIWVCETGRDVDEIGAHTYHHNSGSLGICVCGNYAETEISTGALDVLVLCLEWLCKELHVDETSVYGHKELEVDGYTECPGYDMDVVRQELVITLTT